MIRVMRYNTLPEEIEKYADMPFFSTPRYLNYLRIKRGQKAFWLAGFIGDHLYFIVPFTIIKRLIFRKGSFLSEVIKIKPSMEHQEKVYLEQVIIYLRNNKLCDWIQQTPNWALFRIPPGESSYCKFGTYRIDLEKNSEDKLFQNMKHCNRTHINKALNNYVKIDSGPQVLEDCLKVFEESKLNRHAISNFSNDLRCIVNTLPNNIKCYAAYYKESVQSSLVLFSTNYCAYAVYLSTTDSQSINTTIPLFWQAIKDARQEGIKYFDFVGARISPVPGSKQEGIKRFKKHFGGDFIEGYLWKMPVNKKKYFFYNCLKRISYTLKLKKYHGDIIDQENERTLHLSINQKNESSL